MSQWAPLEVSNGANAFDTEEEALAYTGDLRNKFGDDYETYFKIAPIVPAISEYLEYALRKASPNKGDGILTGSGGYVMIDENFLSFLYPEHAETIQAMKGEFSKIMDAYDITVSEEYEKDYHCGSLVWKSKHSGIGCQEWKNDFVFIGVSSAYTLAGDWKICLYAELDKDADMELGDGYDNYL
jgi:hypothetical protein